MTDIKRMEEPTDQVCEKCGKPMVIKWGRHGKFIACTGYPECTNTRELPAAETGEVSEQDEAEMCDNCGRPMVLKKGRFGQFLACSGYPDCKTTKQLGAAQQQKDVPLEEKCPNCGNHLIKKFGRYGEFVACSNYPTCKFVKQKTIGVKCPNCSEGEVVERRSKRGQDILRLQSLSRLRFRRLGQTDCREVSAVRRQLHDRKILEGWSVRAMPERRMQIQEAP